MPTINLVMIVKNEERCLERCLKSVKPLVDEMIIVDTGSTDRTKQIALDNGARLYDFSWTGDFSEARNYSLEQSDSDWNLVLDADEYLYSASREEIIPFLENKDQLGAIQIRNAYKDGEEISCGLNYTTRLLPRGVFFSGKIHEQVDSSLPRRKVPISVDHDGYLLAGKEERNLPMLIKELEKTPEDSYYLYHVASALRNMERFKEAASYFQQFEKHVTTKDNYFSRGMVSYLYTLIELRKFEEGLAFISRHQESLAPYADFWFACGIFYMKLVMSDTTKYISYLPKIETSYLQCLEIGEKPEHGGILGTGSFKAVYNLGTWYEVSGDLKRAGVCYQLAADENYQPAIHRLRTMGK